MKLNFVKLSPAENTTVLIINNIAKEKYNFIAKKILSYISLNAEQVGFIVKPKNTDSLCKLEMAGGEFCGNAVLATGALMRFLEYSKKPDFKIETSDKESLNCFAEEIKPRIYKVKSEMPLKYNIQEWEYNEDLKLKGVMVEFEGITHILLPGNKDLSDIVIKKIFKQLKKKKTIKALGIIFYTGQDNSFKIKPYVYVPQAGSIVPERSCGSGSLALGIYIATKNRDTHCLEIKQPGGVINVDIICENNRNFALKKAFIETEVEITCKGEVYI